MALRAINQTRDKLLAAHVDEAKRAMERLRGLLGRGELKMGEGLHIDPCNSIHTFFMSFAIDALFLDRTGKVVKVVPALPPWRATRVHFGARSVLELPAGVAFASGTVEGDQLIFEPAEVAAGATGRRGGL